MIDGHGGNIFTTACELGCNPADIHDMSSNVNPLGPPEALLDFLRNNLEAISALPEVAATTALTAFAKFHDLDPSYVIPGNGTTELIYFLPQVLQSRKVLILAPTYADYADSCRMSKVEHEFFMATEDCLFQPDLEALASRLEKYDTVFICNPNNPTGVLIPVEELEQLCRSWPEKYFIIDESYLHFVDEDEKKSMIGRGLKNVIVLNSMSKIFRVPGLRIGFLVADPGVISEFASYARPWSVNIMAQQAVIYLMEHAAETRNFMVETRAFIAAEKSCFLKAFIDIPEISFFPSQTSFLLGRLSPSYRASEVYEHLLKSRILIRNCANFQGLTESFIRIAFKTSAVNTLLVEQLRSLLLS